MRKVTVSEAARILGITPDGVRMRVRRESIKHERDENGRLFVYVDEAEHVGNEVPNMPPNAYIDALKSQIELLRNELEGQRELLNRELEDWKEESRRKDTIIMSLTQRIPELKGATEAPSEEREQSESAKETTERDTPPPTDAAPHEEDTDRPWWRRWFS